MLPTIPLGPVQFPVKPFLLLVAFYLFLWLGEKEARRIGLKGEKIWDAGFYSIVMGVLSGRAAHVVLNWPSYKGDLAQALSLNTNTFVAWPALLAAVLTWIAYAELNKMPLLPLADALSPGAALAWFLISVGNFASGDAYGVPTHVPWGVELWGARRHPTQVYYAVLSFALFLVLWRYRHREYAGRRFLIFLGGAGAIMLLVGAFRANPATTVGGFKMEQVAGLALLVSAMVIDTFACSIDRNGGVTLSDETPESRNSSI